MKGKKDLGLDGILNEVLKLEFKYKADLLISVFNACLAAGVFPSHWKVARIAVMNKRKDDPEAALVYLPLSMMGTAGKLTLKLIEARLTDAIRGRLLIRAIYNLCSWGGIYLLLS